MSQGIRDLMANRKFAVPLIVLLVFCLVGLILVGVVLVLRPGEDEGGRGSQVSGVDVTPSVTAADLVTFTPAPSTATPRPSPTLVPLATADAGEDDTAAATSDVGGDAGAPAATATSSPAATAAVDENGDSELADTGLGWGLILAAGGGLAALVVAARNLRLSRS